MTESDVEACKEGLKNADKNGDGRTSGVEMYKNWSDTCASVFAGNEEFLRRGEEIAIAQGELYLRYAGNDGILSQEEYIQALRSETFGTSMEEYTAIKQHLKSAMG